MKTLFLFSLVLCGCMKVVNPPIEYRVYMPKDVLCPEGGVPILPNGAQFKDFVIIGHGRFAEDNMLLDQCEQRGLLERRDY